MKKLSIAVMALLLLSVFAMAQDEYAERTLLKGAVYFVHGNKQVEKAEYWSLPLGTFDCKVTREFPGEGDLPVEAAVNLSLLSSGYIEGAGYGERGKLKVNADFCVADGDTLKPIELKDIDYIFFGGTKVKLKDGDIEELFIMIETQANRVQAKGMAINVFKYNKDWGELKFGKEVKPLIGFSFTKEGALKAYQAALSAN